MPELTVLTVMFRNLLELLVLLELVLLTVMFRTLLELLVVLELTLLTVMFRTLLTTLPNLTYIAYLSVPYRTVELRKGKLLTSAGFAVELLSKGVGMLLMPFPSTSGIISGG